MAEAYLVFEISQFSSFYFGANVPSMRTRRRRNEEINVESSGGEPMLSVFETKGTAVGSRTQRYLTNEEMNAAQLHIVLNCNEVEPYIA